LENSRKGREKKKKRGAQAHDDGRSSAWSSSQRGAWKEGRVKSRQASFEKVGKKKRRRKEKVELMPIPHKLFYLRGERRKKGWEKAGKGKDFKGN